MRISSGGTLSGKKVEVVNFSMEEMSLKKVLLSQLS
jgi:hypothetical protein